MGKKKGQDRDKYYHLAKDQGYRARSAFKLIEINKKYDFLSQARVCVDLCAAPGGWCQVAAKNMPSGSIILGVDLLPIRPIRNVKSIVSDITTEECRQIIKKELQTWKADVVLCDGAPNVGAAYVKDAYVQNELALAALKVATQHLTKGGTFVTKVYRSQDYNAFMWVVQQFFEEHQAVKPASSRSQSAEIFVVGVNYKKPDFIDPRMLDPRHVFAQDFDDGLKKGITIFHKKFEQHNKRQRQGYAEDLGMRLTRKGTVGAFVEIEDPIRMLTDYHKFEFGPDCAELKDHPDTTVEIKEALADLKLLGKGDFRNLLKWRLKMRDFLEAKDLGERGEDQGAPAEGQAPEATPRTAEEEEADIQAEIKDIKLRMLADKKRKRKKEREAASRLRQRVAMGMETTAVDIPDEESIFTLATIKRDGDLEAIREVNLDKFDVNGRLGGDPVEGEEDGSDDEDSVVDTDVDEEDSEDDEGHDALLELELEEAYKVYLGSRGEDQKKGTRLAKRTKIAKASKAADEVGEDALLFDGDQKAYMELLTGPKGSDDEDDTSSEEDETDNESIASASEPSRAPAAETEVSSAQVDQWFSNPIFAGVEDAFLDLQADAAVKATQGETAGQSRPRGKKRPLPAEGQDETAAPPKGAAKAKTPAPAASAAAQRGGGRRGQEDSGEDERVAEDVIANMPKTDKQIRKEKRKRAADRKERQEKKRQKGTGEDEPDLQVVAADDELEHLAPKAREKALKARALIKAGMGAAIDEGEDEGFEEVSQASNIAKLLRGGAAGLPVMDERAYGSDEEMYDEEDTARQMALGTMMIRKHRAKEIIDAAYNRYAWNDDRDLPDWFVDDEQKHYRPQVPIPAALVQQMRDKFVSLTTKPIKKVAEARARKRKRAMQKLKAAKKKAESLANNPDMSEREKLKAVQGAMKKGMVMDKPSKVYVVARKFQKGKPNTKGVSKGSGKVKFVDSRLKSDMRSMKRAEKKKKKGGGRRK